MLEDLEGSCGAGGSSQGQVKVRPAAPGTQGRQGPGICSGLDCMYQLGSLRALSAEEEVKAEVPRARCSQIALLLSVG